MANFYIYNFGKFDNNDNDFGSNNDNETKGSVTGFFVTNNFWEY